MTTQFNLDNLKEQFGGEEQFFVPENIEKCLLEFKTELYMKRDEAKQTRTDIELTINEINELKRELDTLNKQCDEAQFSWNILMKKSKTMQEGLTEKRDNLQQAQIHYKMATEELDALKVKYQKIETEKNDLLRKIEFFETKQKHTSKYDDEILKREKIMKNTIKNLATSLDKIRLEQNKVIELSKESHLLVGSMKKLKSIQKNYVDLKEDKDKVEELYEQVKAKHDKLKEYMSTSNPIVHKTNLMSKVIFSLWKQDQIKYENDLKETNQKLSYLCEEYQKERIENINIILENEQLRGYNEDLIRINEKMRSKLVEIGEPIKTDDEVEVKQEIIEIIDD